MKTKELIEPEPVHWDDTKMRHCFKGVEIGGVFIKESQIALCGYYSPHKGVEPSPLPDARCCPICVALWKDETGQL